MHMTRNVISIFVSSLLFFVALACEVVAQDYPAKSVRIVQGAAAGGSLDSTARLFAQRFSQMFGQTFIVEARPGASGTIANDRVAKSQPDGYTLLVMVATGSIQAAVRTDLSYNLERDLIPISPLSITPLVLVSHPSVPARNLQDLLGLARKMPGKLNYGSSGIGSTSHFAGEALNYLAKVKLVHIPYKGGAESVVAAASGTVDVSLPGIPPVPGLVNAGKIRALAVTTIERSTLMPSVPTFHEAGIKDYDFSSWAGLLAPMGTPKIVIDRLNEAVIKIASDSEIKESFKKQGLSLRSSTPTEFSEFIRREVALNRKLVKAARIQLQ